MFKFIVASKIQLGWCILLYSLLTMASGSFRNAEHGAKLAQGNTKFALDLFRAIAAKQGDGNIFFSPGSISVALAMTYLGARSNTAKEMKTAMALSDLEDEHLHNSFADLSTSLKETGGNYTLHLANRLFGEKSYKFLQDFLDAQQKHYNAQIKPVDFIKNAEGARQEINQWVEEQTAEKIKDLMPAGSLDELTRLVLVNAIYFKGNWASQFKPDRTKPGDFWLNANDKIQVQMMRQKKHFKYGMSRELDNCQILELPYKGDRLSMFIILPSKPDGLADLESKLTVEHLLDPVKAFKMRSMETEVQMPKFKLEQSFDLGDTLQALGMKDLFSVNKADLSAIDGSRNLVVSKVVHKAFIDINEEGTEAAAATGVGIMLMSMPMEPNKFIVDKPFMFVLYDKSTKNALFLGRGAKPVSGSGATKDEL